MDTPQELEALRAEVARLRAREEELSTRVAALETGLHASESIHRATIEGLPFDFWARDRDGVCIRQNVAACRHWGDLLGKRPEDMNLPPEVLAAWKENNRRALAGEIVRGEQRYVWDGEPRIVHNILAPIRTGDAIVGTLGVNIDITDMKRAEAERATAVQALRHSEEKLRMAVAASGIGLWTWDTHTDVVSWEDPLCAIFGVPPGFVPDGKTGYVGLVHPDDQARVGAMIGHGVQAGGWEDEHRIIRADGAVRWILGKGTVIEVDGHPFVVGALTDVTDRHMREEQLRQTQKLEAVGQLTAGIAHNFNNMLMGILPNLEIAARRSAPEIAPILRSAEHSARRAAELVRQLMTYAGRQRPNERHVESIGVLVARSVAFCRTTFDQRITFESEADEAALARVDALQIEQALLNLLINARDALAGVDAPRITVTVDVLPSGARELEGHSGDQVRIRVRDNGAGMDAATIARIYEPFFTTKEPGKGTGLGLATTHAILREHGGWIACHSTPHEGTTFSLHLPRVVAPVVEERAPSEPPPSRGTETVLVIDDEPGIRNVVALMLDSAGFKCRTAGSGAEAIALLSERAVASTISLVLLDVSMPGMPGRELRRRVSELAPQARVIYFTGYAFEADDANDAVLEKPVRQEELVSKIRHVLDRGMADVS